MERAPGILALVGGGEWQEGCAFDEEFLAASGSDQVLVLPTAAAYEHPERAVVAAGEWFAPLGGRVEGLMVLSRADAEDDGAAAVMRNARFVYLVGGSPMHVRSVLKNSTVWNALVEAWQGGAVVVGSSGAAMALTDPMVDARGGGLTIGLGLVTGVAVVPHFGDAQVERFGAYFVMAAAFVLAYPRRTIVVAGQLGKPINTFTGPQMKEIMNIKQSLGFVDPRIGMKECELCDSGEWRPGATSQTNTSSELTVGLDPEAEAAVKAITDQNLSQMK